jgi:hypothetical protein
MGKDTPEKIPVSGADLFPAPEMGEGLHVLPGKPAFLSDHLAFSYPAGIRCQDIASGKQVKPAPREILKFQRQAGIIPRRTTRYRADQKELIPVCTNDESRTRLFSRVIPKFNRQQEDVSG